jgi:hypothetical protein
VRDAPAASHAKKKAYELVTTGSPKQSGIPCTMVLRLISGLSLVIGLFCHHHQRDAKHHRKLDVSVETSGPHGLAVRIKCRSSGDADCGHRIPRSTFVTIAKRPSGEAGWRCS